MTKSTKWTAALLALGLGTSAAYAADPTQKELMAQIEALKAKVNAMEQKQATYDSRDIDATVAAVLRDSDHHSMMIDGGAVNAGFNPKKGQFFIQTEDGSSYFHPAAIFQFRNVTNYRENSGAKTGQADTINGFEVRRMKIGFDGNVFSKDLTFKFQWQNNLTGAPTLEYAWGDYVFAHNVLLGGDLAFRAGQFKDVPFKEQAIINDNTQLMVERSIADTFVGGNAVSPLQQGVDFKLTGKDTPLHVDLAFTGGQNSGNTDFQKTFSTTTQSIVGGKLVSTTKNTKQDFGAAGRVDYKVFGDWSDTTDMTGVLATKDLLDIGGGISFTQLDGLNVYRADVDAQYIWAKKLSVFAAVYADEIDTRNVATGHRHDYAGVAEAGYFITPAIQATARYSIVMLDKNFKVGNTGQFHEISAGVNWFLGPDGAWGNHAKVSFDVTYLPNGTPGTTGLDFLPTTNKQNEFVGRVQLQLWI